MLLFYFIGIIGIIANFGYTLSEKTNNQNTMSDTFEFSAFPSHTISPSPMGKANYVHDGPPPGIGFEAVAPASYPPPASEVDDGGSEVPDLLSHLDPANGPVTTCHL